MYTCALYIKSVILFYTQGSILVPLGVLVPIENAWARH